MAQHALTTQLACKGRFTLGPGGQAPSRSRISLARSTLRAIAEA